MLGESLLGYSRIALALNASEEIRPEDLLKFNDALERLKNEEPIQYIIGVTEFYGLPFKVSPETLIPRPETEELVEWIIRQNKEQAVILDIGTGSGCIAITLAKNLKESVVSALDVSVEALKVAAYNAQHNKVSIDFITKDILAIDKLPSQYDIIVSNPPYVRNLEKKTMSDNVLQFEPSAALFVPDDDPLKFYRKISSLAKTHLKEGGSLFFEINEYLGEELVALLKNFDFKNIELGQDFRGKDRFIKCTRSLNE
ncbi:MAG: peptide chain release factor N(5)-glutamine methyltransferase [Bacteroidia bacterium]|nr:peptide chain release factor N(5)-glutamine methyltransferase [Bacteroidia bacterium]